MIEVFEDIQITQSYSTVIRHGAFEKKLFHRHMNWEFALFHTESINYVNDAEHHLPPYSIIAVSDDALHRILCPNNDHYHIDVYISDDALREICTTNFSGELYASLRDLPCACCTLSKQEFEFISKRLVSVSNPNIPESARKSLIRSMIILILGYFYQHIESGRRIPPNWLAEFVKKIQDPSVFTLPMEDIRRLSGYSKSRLAGLFQEYYSYTLFEYIRDMRMRYAKTSLRYSTSPISEISSLCGYNSLSAFINAFKKATGKTPSDYRKAILISNEKTDTQESL